MPDAGLLVDTGQHVMECVNDIAGACSEEEVSFNRTLDKGIARFKKAAAAAKAQGQKDIDSKDAFEMWDTYGFPVDLTQVMRKKGATHCA